ncbi:MAG: histidinol phosphatase [Bacteroidia bacterium]
MKRKAALVLIFGNQYPSDWQGMIFSRKKESINKSFINYVDFHNHSLPAVDDGAKSIEQSLEMLKAFKSLGMRGVVITPHILKGAYPNRKENIHEVYNNLKPHLVESGLDEFVINVAAEHMLDEDFMELLKSKALLCLTGNYILIEMSYFQKPAFLKPVLFDLLSAGYQAILAHPERYNFINDLAEYQDLKTRGCSFQLNLLSLTDHYGPHVQKKAFQLLKAGYYDYAGTDAHHIQHITKIGKIEVPKKYVSEVQRIMANNSNLFFK